MSAPHWLERHRGPFRFEVVRLAKKAGHIKTEWLPGSIDQFDVESEAGALLTDPRDSIVSISVWSLADNQFVHTYTRKDFVSEATEPLREAVA